ncbi:hypothetical protein CBF29_12990 [Vagococcus elongatus]|uniref:Uncharacterized protein n=2 Tax=Vagococcus elongatus TaxID=180344 RepID=A0A430ALV0_9ENTE|nr:hypothetical protein CBF29_12990 [Vagococcus elongatus]
MNNEAGLMNENEIKEVLHTFLGANVDIFRHIIEANFIEQGIFIEKFTSEDEEIAVLLAILKQFIKQVVEVYELYFDSPNQFQNIREL